MSYVGCFQADSEKEPAGINWVLRYRGQVKFKMIKKLWISDGAVKTDEK